MPQEKGLWATAISEVTPDAREELGVIREENDTTWGKRTFKYVRWDNGTANIAGAAGQVVYYIPASYATTVVTPDLSDSKRNLIAGVMPYAMTDQYYGWMQVLGKCTVNTDGGDDISAGDNINSPATADGVCDSNPTSPGYMRLGVALEDDNNVADTVLAVLVLGSY